MLSPYPWRQRATLNSAGDTLMRPLGLVRTPGSCRRRHCDSVGASVGATDASLRGQSWRPEQRRRPRRRLVGPASRCSTQHCWRLPSDHPQTSCQSAQKVVVVVVVGALVARLALVRRLSSLPWKTCPATEPFEAGWLEAVRGSPGLRGPMPRRRRRPTHPLR